MKKELTVIQVLPSLVSGGVEKGTLEVAKFLVEKGHKSIVISGGGRMVDQLIREGSNHIQWPIGKKSLFTITYLVCLIRLMQKTNVDIIHARSRLPAWIVFIALKLISKKRRPHFITTVHGFNSVSLYSSIMTKGDRVIVVSNAIKSFILKHYNFDKNKIPAESYRRFAKALMTDGNKGFFIQKPKLDFEIIALTSPYNLEEEIFEFQLFEKGDPLENWQITIFSRDEENNYKEIVKTNPNGMGKIKIFDNRTYLISAVKLDKANYIEKLKYKSDWFSLWATLVFKK